MRKSIDPMSDRLQLGSGNSWLPPQRSSVAMSFQSAIPWRVALRQSLPPLHRLATILNNPLCRTMIFQRTAITPLTSCLSPRVHSTNAVPSPAPHPGWNRKTGQASLIQVRPNVSIKVGPNQVVKRNVKAGKFTPEKFAKQQDKWSLVYLACSSVFQTVRNPGVP